MSRQKVVKEKETIYPEHDDDIIPEGNEKQQEVGNEADAFYNFVGAFVESPYKVQVHRIVQGKPPIFLGEISPTDGDLNAPHEAIRSRWGGGDFQIRFVDPQSGELKTFGPIVIEGPPKGEPATQPPFTINVPGAPPLPAGASSEAMMVSALVTMMQESARQNAAMLVEFVKAMKPPAVSPQSQSIRETIEIFKLMKEGDGNSTKKWEFWIDAIGKVVDRVSGLIPGAVPDSPGMFLVQQLLPTIKDLAGTYAAKLQAPAVLPRRNEPEVDPRLLGSAAPAPEGAKTVTIDGQEYQLPDAATRAQWRGVFEQTQLPRIIEAAAKDLDPYSVAYTFRSYVPDTRMLLPLIDLADQQAFYALYPATRQYQDWFDELFSYLLNPNLEPPADEDEEVIEVPQDAASPKNGKAARGKVKPVEVQQ